jgi:superfamily II DNA helicase RecQ
MGPQPAEQVVLVIGTGSSKTLVVMVGATVADARTTILVLPIVALRGDMLRRFHSVCMRPLIWSIDCKQSASLVIVSAEAACIESFLEYAHRLVSRQKLDRIVVDGCHLITTLHLPLTLLTRPVFSPTPSLLPFANVHPGLRRRHHWFPV